MKVTNNCYNLIDLTPTLLSIHDLPSQISAANLQTQHRIIQRALHEQTVHRWLTCPTHITLARHQTMRWSLCPAHPDRPHLPSTHNPELQMNVGTPNTVMYNTRARTDSSSLQSRPAEKRIQGTQSLAMNFNTHTTQHQNTGNPTVERNSRHSLCESGLCHSPAHHSQNAKQFIGRSPICCT